MHSPSRHLLGQACLLLLIANTAAGQRSGSAGRLASHPVRAMSFNIRYGTANDRLDRWSLRKHRVVQRVRAYAPDVLGIQEALHFQVEQLRVALPGYTVVGVHRQGGKTGEASALFIRPGRFAIEESGTFWLSLTPDRVASKGWDAVLPRICTWTILRDRRRHNRFLLANTHFDHRGRVARLESAKLISAWSKIFGLPVVLMGDLNARESSRPVQWLKSHGLRDAFRVAHPDAEEVGTFNGFARRQARKIDYVLCSAQFRVHGAGIDTVVVDDRFPSDHFPVTAELSLPAGEPPKLCPVLSGEPWHIGDNPALGGLTGDKQQIVDHAIFQSSDGQWHLWACIRGTVIGRLIYAWEGDTLEQVVWRQKGIALRASRAHGESIDDWGGKEWIQAPHVIRHEQHFYMLFGGHRTELEHCQINLATSRDGRVFERHRNALGQSRVFVGPGEARDPMTIRIGDEYHCYYTGNPDPMKRRDVGGVYCRRSKDLIHWSPPRRVCYGGNPGSGMWSAECPHVVEREGFYYLFRTTSYRIPLTHVYRSEDPLDFGLDNDDKLIGTIAVAAPEIVSEHGRDYISSVHDLSGGVQLTSLRFVREGEAPNARAFLARLMPLFDFEKGGLSGWKSNGTAFADQPTYTGDGRTRTQATNVHGHYYIGTYENDTQGDKPQGTLRSPGFELPKGHVAFRLGGGRDAKRVYVALYLQKTDRELRRATGNGSNFMHWVIWDVQRFAGREAYLKIVDASSARWGHINFDDFRVERAR